MKRLFILLLAGAMALTAQTASAYSTVDTIRNLSPRDTLTLYTFSGQNSGYLSGNNSYGDQQKAELFTGPNGGYLTGALIGFGYANILPADSTVGVVINAYTGNAGTGPGATIASDTVTLGQIAAAITAGTKLYVPFAGQPLLSPQTFFISVVLPATGDTIAILTNQQDATDGQGWEQWNDNTWHSWVPTYGTFPYQFGLDIEAITQAGQPLPAFFSTLLYNCGGSANVTFYNNSSNTVGSIQWYFPGGTPSSSTSDTVVVSYADTGSYPVYLIASVYSYTDTLVSAVQVFTQITASTSSTPATGSTATGTATVTGLTGNAPLSYVWSDANSDTSATITGLTAGTYYVTITSAPGCFIVDSAVVTSINGIATLNGVNAIQVYPNPADNMLNINWGTATTVSYSIADMSGRELKAYAVSGTQVSTIDISWLASGTYQITVAPSKGRAAQSLRFVKM